MNTIGVKDWSFFDAVDVRGKAPYWVGVALSHRESLVTAEYPCIVFEDDIATTEWWKPTLDVPADSVIYLGVSKWGTRTGYSELNGATFRGGDYGDCCRVEHMTSAHAIYYPNREVAMKFSDGIVKQIMENARPFDEWYASKQSEYPTYCLKQPLFYQDCNRNEMYTNFEVLV
jgi:hypothetical protein